MREHQACPALLQAPACGVRPAHPQAQANALTSSEMAELRRLLNHQLVEIDEKLNDSRPASLVARQRQVSAAFDRIEAGIYGRCCQRGCDAWLPFERLKDDPATPLCAACESRADVRRKPG